MNNIDSLLNDIIANNKIREEELQEEVKETEVSSYIEMDISNLDKICEFEELLKIIRDNNFDIINYKKLQKTEENWYNETLEKYLCNYNNWQFEICGMSDVDIEEGIFGVYKITNLLTNEVFEMYLDLGCRNTSKLKFQWFKELINGNNIKEFLDSTFGRFYNIPSLYESQGYSVDSSEFKFDDFFHKRCASLILEKDSIKLYLSIYYGFFEEDFFVCISNKKNWGINDFSTIFDKKYVEYVKYLGDESFNELKIKTESVMASVNGLVGFNFNNEVFNNTNLYCFFDSLKHKVRYNDDFNHYHIRFEIPNFLNRDDGNASFKVSKFSGRELFGIINVSFNDAAQWSIGETAVNVTFEVLYDKNIDDENIILNLYVYKSNNQTHEVEFESEESEMIFEEEDSYDMIFKYAKKELQEIHKFNSPNDLKNFICNYLQNISDKFGYVANFNSSKNLW